jgi:hypothetical protein
VNKHAPIKEMTFNPCITSAIRDEMNIRDES